MLSHFARSPGDPTLSLNANSGVASTRVAYELKITRDREGTDLRQRALIDSDLIPAMNEALAGRVFVSRLSA